MPALFAEAGEEHQIALAILHLVVEDGKGLRVELEREVDGKALEDLGQNGGDAEVLVDAIISAQAEQGEARREAK
jgi:hypothetical protein